MRGEGFEVLVQREPFGPLLPVAPPTVRTYRGTVVEMPGSRVAALLTGNAEMTLTASIRTAHGVYAIQPVRDLVPKSGAGWPATPVGEHVVYFANDWVNRGGFGCGTTNAHRPLDVGEQQASGGVAGTGLALADLAIDTDVEFYQRNGSDVTNTVLDVENVMNTVEFIYERDLTITYELTTIVVRTVEPDPYSSTDAGTLLCQFRAQWNGTPESFIRRDTAHLFTGKNMDGNTIGIAWVGVMCNPSAFIPGCGGRGSVAYGVSESTFSGSITSRAALTAHELGHNWDAGHCTGSTCHIMCAGLGGCGGLFGSNLKFGPDATAEILAHKASRTCLASLPDPLWLPFVDDFAFPTLSTTNWSYIEGATVESGGVNEPSGPNALTLDASGPEEYRDDEIRSNFISVFGARTPTLSYWTQHRGVPAGGALVVDYWSNAAQWVELDRIISDGIDQSVFDFHVHELPFNARHDRFRLRLRAEVDDAGADWFVDDVMVVDACPQDISCDDGVFCNGLEHCIDGLCEAGASPCAEGESCDEQFRTCFDPACATPELAAEGGRYLAITPLGSDPVGLIVAPACDPQASWYVGASATAENIATPAQDPASAPLLTPTQWGGTVYVTGAEVVPGTDYIVRANCGTANAPRLSAFATARTPVFGDAVGEYTGTEWTPADGIVDIRDIRAIIEGFIHASTAPSTPRIDLIASDVSTCSTDQSIDVLDMLSWVNGFVRNSFGDTWSCAEPCSASPD